jgi:hypothetical protein
MDMQALKMSFASLPRSINIGNFTLSLVQYQGNL